MVSVIIPVYNGEQFVRKSVESVIKQTYNNVEIIVVNDGSTDGTNEILNEIWGNYNPNGQIVTIPNGGLANARNVGIGKAKGKYICNLDADDYLEPDIFEKIFKKYSDFDVCYYGFQDVDIYGKSIFRYNDRFIYKNNISGNEALLYKLNRTIWICQGCALYRKELIDRYQIYNVKGINQGEDLYFICLMLAYSDKVKCIDEIGVNLLVREESMMHQRYNESYKQSIIASKNLYNRILSIPEYKNDYKVLKLIKCHIMEQSCYVAKRMIGSKQYSIKKLIHMIGEIRVSEFDELSTLKNELSKRKYLQFLIYKKSIFAYIICTKLVYCFRKVK